MHGDRKQIKLDKHERAIGLAMARRLNQPHDEWVWTQAESVMMAQYCLWANQRLEAIGDLAKGKGIPNGC